MEKERSPDSVILWYNPYGTLDRDKSSNGVNDLFQEGKPYIESKGFKIISVAPKVGDNSSNVADYNLGETVQIPKLFTKLIGTSLPLSLPYDKRKARDLIVETKPDFLFLEEPTQGFGAHGLMSGMPRREDGKPVPVVGARFHAGIYGEFADGLFRAIISAGKRAKRPKFSKHGILVPNGRLSPGIVNTLLKDLMFRIANSEATAKAFESRLKDKKEYEVVYNGINTGELTPDGQIMEEWTEDGKDIILSAMGRLEKRKDVESAIEGYAIVKRERPNIKLIIAGDGPEKESLKTMVHSKQIPDVKFVGILSHNDYVKARRTASVSPCTPRGGEGFGRVVVESLACGVPVIASDVDGYNEATEGGQPFALMSEPKNPDDIARKIIEVLDWSPETREKMKWEAVCYVRERFAWPIIADQMAKVLNESYNNHGGVDWSKLPNFGTIYKKR